MVWQQLLQTCTHARNAGTKRKARNDTSFFFLFSFFLVAEELESSPRGMRALDPYDEKPYANGNRVSRSSGRQTTTTVSSHLEKIVARAKGSLMGAKDSKSSSSGKSRTTSTFGRSSEKEYERRGNKGRSGKETRTPGDRSSSDLFAVEPDEDISLDICRHETTIESTILPTAITTATTGEDIPAKDTPAETVKDDATARTQNQSSAPTEDHNIPHVAKTSHPLRTTAIDNHKQAPDTYLHLSPACLAPATSAFLADLEEIQLSTKHIPVEAEQQEDEDDGYVPQRNGACTVLDIIVTDESSGSEGARVHHRISIPKTSPPSSGRDARHARSRSKGRNQERYSAKMFSSEQSQSVESDPLMSADLMQLERDHGLQSQPQRMRAYPNKIRARNRGSRGDWSSSRSHYPSKGTYAQVQTNLLVKHYVDKYVGIHVLIFLFKF